MTEQNVHDLLGRLRNRLNDSPIPSEQLMDESIEVIENLSAKLSLAISHIDHMAAWISEANRDYHVGIYSFESLCEDMPGIRAVLVTP